MNSSRHSETANQMPNWVAMLFAATCFILLSTKPMDASVPGGNVVGWGETSSGQTPTPASISNVVAVTAGGAWSMVLKCDGTVEGWGYNIAGQLNVPPFRSEVIAIAAGYNHALALLRDTTVTAWGENEKGQSTVPMNLTGVVAIAAGELHSLALKRDGTVVTWGANDTGQQMVPANLSGVIAIAAGNSHSMALKEDGTVVAWGQNNYGQSTVPTNLSGVIGIAAGYNHCLALRADRTVVAWGFNNSGQTTVPTNLTGVVAMAGGYSHSLALRLDGEVVAWGYNYSGQTAVPTNLSGVIAIAAGAYHSLALIGDPATIGQPFFSVDGFIVTTSSAYGRGSVTVGLSSTFLFATMLYTLDGSDPSTSARLYNGPFVLTKSATLRAVAYNADFTQSAESDPLEIIILPTLNTGTEGGGAVAIDPPAGAYFSNDLAVVTATPAPGWTFLHWLGDETGTNPIATMSMNRNKCVQAVFGTALGNTVVGSGSVVRSPAAELYPHGTPVRLTAVPQAGNYFALWGNAATGTNNPLTFAVTNPNPTVTAVFAALPANQHALTVVPDGFGTVTNSPRGNRFGNGTNVTLRALPEPGQDFLGWSGDASGANNPLVVTMNQSKVITANFSKRPRLAPMLCEGVPNGEEFQLLLTGKFDGRYSIEATTNLAPAALAWEPLATLTNTFGSAQFNDPAPTNRPQRFYRAVVP